MGLEAGDPRGVRRFDELLGPAGVHDELLAGLAALLFDGYYARPRADRATPNPYDWFALSDYPPA